MNELVKMVADRVGVGDDKAKTAVDTVVGYLKQKLPQPIAGQIDQVVGGGSGGSGGGVTGAIGDVMGNTRK